MSLEVTGPIAVKIFVSCDCRDFDLWFRLLDLAPDGTAFNLMSPGLDVQRASYREMKKGGSSSGRERFTNSDPRRS